MSASVNKFERFRQEHARLHDPALARGAVELVPVELSELAGGVAPNRKKKKKHGVRGGWTAAHAEPQPVAEPPEDERLLPRAFLHRLSAQPGIEAPGAKGAVPYGEPRVECEPVSVACRLSLFEEQAFAVDAPAAQQVELVWREAPVEAGGTTEPEVARAMTRGVEQRVPMDHTEGDRFETRIGIADGAYLFAFAADGHMRADASLARRVLLGAAGLFAPQAFARYERTLTLTNNSKFAERVKLEASEPWLAPAEEEIVLPARGSAEARVRLRLADMRSGSNEALLRLTVEREEGGRAAGAVHFAAHVEAGGAVPEIHFAPREFGEVRRGIDEAELRIAVTARGSGALDGVISLPQPGALADFRLSADSVAATRFEHTFRIAAADLPPPQPRRAEATLRLLVRTDSFLANHRVFRAEIPYRLVYLKPLLPALSFGTVRAGATKSMRLDVERSDGEEIELSVALPGASAPYLEAYPARSDAYVFRFDAAALAPGTDVSETVELIDKRSGLREQIKVLAKVAPAAGGPAPEAAASVVAS